MLQAIACSWIFGHRPHTASKRPRPAAQVPRGRGESVGSRVALGKSPFGFGSVPCRGEGRRIHNHVGLSSGISFKSNENGLTHFLE